MNRKQSIFNIVANLLNKLVIISFGLILPKMIITTYGSEVNGLLASVSNLFIYINLLEAGISLSAVQALYGPISQKNQTKIDGIVRATDYEFRKIGIYVLACTIIIGLLYPIIVTSKIAYWTIVGIIFIQGFATVLDYFIIAKMRVLLQAEAKAYIISNINTVVTILTNITKIVLILLGGDIIQIQLSFAIFGLFKVLVFKIYMSLNYSKVDKNIKPNFKAISNRKYAFAHNFVFILSSNIDILILTLFTDLLSVSVYTIYRMIFTSVAMFTESIISGVNASFGQLFAKDKESFLRYFVAFERLYLMLGFSLFTIACILTFPFLTLYTQGINDINYIIVGLPVLFMLVELLNNIRALNTKVIHYAGHFQKTMKPAFIEVIANIVLSVVLVNFIGLHGVLLATIISQLYRIVVYINYTNDFLLNRNKRNMYMIYIVNLLITFLVISIFYFMPISPDSYIEFFIYASAFTLLVTTIFISINLLIRRNEWLLVFSKFKVFSRFNGY